MNSKNKRIKTIEWAINNVCNYNCSYCTLGKHKIANKVEMKNYEQLIDNLKVLDGSFNIMLSGCEPLIITNLPDIISKIVNETEHTISICTNFSLSVDKTINILDIIGDRYSWLTASLHLERCNVKRFLLKANKINNYLVKKRNKRLTIVSVAVKDKLRYLEKIGDKAMRDGINFNLQPMKVRAKGSIEYSFIKYTKSEKDIIKKFRRPYGIGKVNFVNKICYAGVDYLIIKPTGDVFRCHPAARDHIDSEGYLGNIFTNTFKAWKRPRKCIYQNCNCVVPHQKNMVEKN